MTVAAQEFSHDPAAANADMSNEMFVEFRCGTCYQVRHESARKSGENVACPYCSGPNSVPALDENTMRTAAQVQAAGVSVEAGQFTEKEQTHEEKLEAARIRAEARAPSFAYGEHAIGVHAQVSTRGIAKVIDILITGVAAGASFALGEVLADAGLCLTMDQIARLQRVGDTIPPSFWLCHGIILALVSIVFWWMIANLGQTPGKMLLGIKIVDAQGDPPGFLRGVAGRTWGAGFLIGMIPCGNFFNYGLAWYASPPRCIHDHIAGTYVVLK